MKHNSLSEKDQLIKELREKQNNINNTKVTDAIKLKIKSLEGGKTIRK